MKEQKNKKTNYINFNYSEEFITNLEKPTKDDLKSIFNKKYFDYIKRIEDKESEHKT